ncbi:penicillin-binding protein, 1A family [Alteribacillus persepolensis]|uniref:Penicillin-binding protein, 1A family n=1 Tax=Alteribacillus persepolensis TaxID=568899 RepID=A0A1G8G539_9BACI|nr:PBP1A family penicillin-binding protein [Alteribacillus persepolensis]SDH89497.1 penicillin-binding protein, 1A family [Alteribacillus persepolensis]
MNTALKRHSQPKLSWWRKLLRCMLLAGVLFTSSALVIVTSAIVLEAPPIQVDQTTVFYGADHSVIGESHHGNKRYWIELEDISPSLIDAVISVEDREFYEHNGFDIPRIMSAIAANIKSGSKAQGASTITQQYARNLFLTHDKTWSRKLEEAFYALRLETHYDKEDILEGYLNTIYFGHGAYGIEAASKLYFDKSASQLTLSEASLLAGIPKGPSYYSPFSYPDRAKGRQRVVLASMEATGAITTTERQQAEQTEWELEPPGQLADERTGPYFQDHIEQLIESTDLNPQLMERGGLHVYTTLDPELQQLAEKWVELETPKDSDIQAALAVIDPHSGDVRALVGGKNYEESTYNRVIHAKRQPGSAIKPFLYYAALESGFTPLTSFRSEPTEFQTGTDGNTYTPGNYGEKYANDFIDLEEALAVSDNIYAMKTHLFLGPDALVNTAEKVGITTELDPIPSLALGTQGVRIIDMAAGYSALTNGGQSVKPRFIQKITDSQGNVLMEQKQETKQVLDPKKSYVLTDMMQSMFDLSLDSYTSATGASIAHLIDRPLAGKSGSTDYDSWMVGSSPQLTTAVWVGYDDNREMNHAQEGQVSKRIWAQFMREGLEDELKLAFSPPDGIVKTDIDPETGLLSSEECGPSRTIAFEAGTEPTKSCTDEMEKEAQDGEHRDQHENKLPEKEEKFFDRLKKWFE